jgi:predicted permease
MRSEHWIYTVPLRLRSLFRRKHVEQELDDELRFHLEQRVEEEIAKGRTAEEARNIARRAMEGLEQKKEECRDTRRLNPIENLGRDLRYALRMLRKSPVFASVAVLSLALGIGANTAIFSLIDTLLLRPLPVSQPGRLVQIWLDRGSARPSFAFTHALFEQTRANSSVFSGVFTWSDNRFQMRSGREMVHVNGVLAGGDYFAALGVPAVIGRTFTAAEDVPNGGKNGPVAVISYEFWSSRFQRNSAVIGSTITLDGVDFTVIGVMPRQFFGADVSSRPDIWAPLALAPRVEDPVCFNSRSCWWLFVMARLAPGVSLEKARAQLKVVSPQILLNTVPPNWDRADQRRFKQYQLIARPAPNGWSFLRLRFTNPLAILMTLVGIVLLIACANLANLLFARSSARQREIAVRLAMGAGRSRIVRQLLTESVLLSCLGGLAGLGFAFASTRLLLSILTASASSGGPGQDIRFDLQPDWRILVFTFLAALFSGLLFGLAPALRATRIGIIGSLKERAHTVRGTGSRMGVGRLILGFQAALSVLLICAAGLFAGSLWRLWTLNPGFNPKNLFLVGIDTDRRSVKGDSPLHLYGQLQERLNAIPGVEAASLLWMTPLSEGGWDDNPSIPGRTNLSDEQRHMFINLAAPRFFVAMGTPLLAGREFNSADSSNSERVGIINQLAARRFFPNRNPIGEHIQLERTLIRIVGVAGNSKYLDLRDPEPLELYLPYTQNPSDDPSRAVPSLTFVIRSALKPAAVDSSFRNILRKIAPDIPLSMARSMEDQVAASLDSERLMALLSLFFGVLALLLTSIGLYGVLAYSVAQRTNEIGVRMALGAQRRDVILLVMRESMAYVAIGISAGVITVLGTSRLVSALLYGIRPNDAGNLALAVILFLLVAGTAAYLPARRASHLEPLVALREE